MGNNPTKPVRPGVGSQPGDGPSSSRIHNLTHSRSNRNGGPSSSNHQHYSLHNQQQQHQQFLQQLQGTQPAAPAEGRRLTRREREARRLKNELETREVEREWSVKNEHVDYGYLVTLGTYSLSEDFNKPIIRRLIIERRLAPFWRGLDDLEDTWTEHQIIAAAKGMPIPEPDEIPSKDLSVQAPSASDSENISQPPSTDSPSTVTSDLTPLVQPRPSGSDPIVQELNFPHDQFYNGQRIEVFLYKQAEECPICFLYYPPYLNKTRCCEQPICTECFVQIRRADPHPPEHPDPSSSSNSEEPQLVVEPTCCPYCQTSMFGVSYDPPPFRRGLTYDAQALGAAPDGGNTTVARRRAGSLSADNPIVVTSDHIRPDWEKKLHDARAKAAQRSATATAIHTAALLMSNPALGGGFSFRRLRNTGEGGDQRAPQTVDDLLLEMAIRMSLTDRAPENATTQGGDTSAPANSNPDSQNLETSPGAGSDPSRN